MAAFADLLGPSLVAPSTSKVKRFDTLKTAEVLANTCVGLVFAADWSEESRAFVARLVEAHAAVVAGGSAFQPVLVSSDRNVDAFARLLGAPRPVTGACWFAAHASAHIRSLSPSVRAWLACTALHRRPGRQGGGFVRPVPGQHLLCLSLAGL